MSQAPALVLLDDDVARGWRPFSLTRPVGELLFGTRTLRSRAELSLGLDCVGHVADGLDGYDEPGAPPVLARHALPLDRPLVVLLSRYVAEPFDLPDPAAGPHALLVDGQLAGAVYPAGQGPDDAGAVSGAGMREVRVPGRLLTRVWELMSGNAERVARDIASRHDAADGRSALPAGVHVLGDGRLVVGTDVHVAPGVVLDTRHGPIQLADGVTVKPFTSVAGPSYVGPGSSLLGGPFEAVGIGPVCKVHGEMEESVVLGYSNKAHDGFLGHAYLGMWVNLGALTTNSDLKNNYGPVRIWTPAGDVDTGERKIGCFIGDHVKTAIGTMINTGTVVEAGSNIFGGMPPKYVPPFSWGDPDTAYGVDRFLETAETVMGRRDVALTDGQRSLLRNAWQATRG